MHLYKLADSIAEQLTYFKELERIAKFLESTNEELCLHADFIPILARIDVCIDFMDACVCLYRTSASLILTPYV